MSLSIRVVPFAILALLQDSTNTHAHYTGPLLLSLSLCSEIRQHPHTTLAYEREREPGLILHKEKIEKRKL